MVEVGQRLFLRVGVVHAHPAGRRDARREALDGRGDGGAEEQRLPRDAGGDGTQDLREVRLEG